jgi:hypothetical protein
LGHAFFLLCRANYSKTFGFFFFFGGGLCEGVMSGGLSSFSGKGEIDGGFYVPRKPFIAFISLMMGLGKPPIRTLRRKKRNDHEDGKKKRISLMTGGRVGKPSSVGNDPTSVQSIQV